MIRIAAQKAAGMSLMQQLHLDRRMVHHLLRAVGAHLTIDAGVPSR